MIYCMAIVSPKMVEVEVVKSPLMNVRLNVSHHHGFLFNLSPNPSTLIIREIIQSVFRQKNVFILITNEMKIKTEFFCCFSNLRESNLRDVSRLSKNPTGILP